MTTNEYMAAYMAKRYERRRIHYIDKMGGKCVTCGSTHSLEFDHIDPNQNLPRSGDVELLDGTIVPFGSPAPLATPDPLC